MARYYDSKFVHWVVKRGRAVHQSAKGGLVTLIGRPTGLAAVVGGNAITLAWNAPANWSLMRPLRYQFAVNDTTSSVPSSATSHVLANLVPGDYAIRVRGQTVNGFTRWSNGVTATIERPIVVDLKPVVSAYDRTTQSPIDNLSIGAVTGGDQPVTVAATGLPSTVAFDASDLTISGTASNGTYDFTLTATDADGDTDSADATLTVQTDPPPPPPDLTPIVQANNFAATRNALIEDVAIGSASGGDPPLSVEVTGLPSGITADTSDLSRITVSGRSPGPDAPATSSAFTITATDNDGDSASAIGTITWTTEYTPPLTCTAYNVRTVTNLLRAVIGYVSGGVKPVTVVATGLPVGMTFNPADLSISGAALAGAYPFTLTATDSSTPAVTESDSATLTLFSDAQPPDQFPNVVANDLTIERRKPVAGLPLGLAYGGNGVLTVEVTGLPSGLVANVTDPSNITISGQTADSRASVDYRISATDMDVGRHAPSDTTFATGTITLSAAFAPVLTCSAKEVRRKEQLANVVIGTLSGNTVGTVVTATGLPTGLTASVVGGNVVMSGRTLDAPGAFPFTLTALAVNGTMDTCTSTITLQAALRPTLALSDVTVRRNRVLSIAAGTYTPGNLPLQRDLAVVVLPAGLRYTFDSGIVTLSGRTTAAAGTFTAQATIFDGDGDAQVPPVPATATITIREPTPPVVTCAAALTVEANKAFSNLVVGSIAGGFPPFSIDSVAGVPNGALYSIRGGTSIRVSGVVGEASRGTHHVALAIADADGVVGTAICSLSVTAVLVPCTPTISASSSWNFIAAQATATTGSLCGDVDSWEFVYQAYNASNATWLPQGAADAQSASFWSQRQFITQETRYRVRCRAFNTAGASGWSAWAETTTTRRPSAPGVPRLPACTMGPGNQVTVTCQPPTDRGTPAFHQWNIRWEEEFDYGDTEGNGGSVTIQGTGAVSHTVTLPRVETFSFFFSCTNTVGTGPEVYLECNADDYINLPCDGPFEAVVGARINEVLSAATITAAGRAAGVRAGGIIYTLDIPQGVNAPAKLTDPDPLRFNASRRRLTGTPVRPNPGYQMRYRATYSSPSPGGFDVCEIALNVSDRGIGRPAAILHSATKNSMQGTFSPGGNTNSMRYRFWEGGASDEPDTAPIATRGTGATIDFPRLKKGTLYSARCWGFFPNVAPTNLALGVASGVYSLSTLDDLPPDTPRQPYCIPRTVVTELGFGWQPPQETAATEPPTSYEYQYRANSTGAWSTLVAGVSLTAREVTLTGLLEGTPYQIRVRGRNVKGSGGWQTFVCRTKTTEPPGAARNLTCDSHTKVSIRFMWDAPEVIETGDSPHGSASGYQYRVDGGAWQSSGITATGIRSSVVVTGLEPTSDVFFEVRAWNLRGGVRQYGAITSITCLTDVEFPLDLPLRVNLFTFRVRETAYYLLPEATGGRPPYSYSLTGTLPPGIAFDGSQRRLGGTATAPRTRTDHNYTVTDRDDETDFAVVGVRVIDVAPPPFLLECKAATINSLTIGWGEPSAIGSPITGYRWRYKRGSAADFGAWAALGSAAREAATPATLFSDEPYDFEVEATNPAGMATATITCRTLADANRPPLALAKVPPRLGPYTIGESATQAMPEATGGYPPYEYEASGTLISDGGFSFNPELHRIQGAATRAGVWTLTLRVTDLSGASVPVEWDDVNTIAVIPDLTLPVIATKTTDIGSPLDTTDAYWTLPEASGGEGDITYSLKDASDDTDLATTAVIGISFNPATRGLSGTMTRRRTTLRDGSVYTYGAIECVYTATDSGNPARTAVREFLLYADSDPQTGGIFRWGHYFDIQDMNVGQGQFLRFPRLRGGTPPYTIDRTPQVTHPGLTLDYDEGALVGAPTEPTPPVAGDTNDPPDRQYARFRGLVARDSTGTLANFWDPVRTTDKTSGPTQWKVFPADETVDDTLRLAQLLLVDLVINQQADIPLPRALAGTPPYEYDVTTTIPGMNYIANAHRLSGVPTTIGTYTVVVQVEDAAGATASRSGTVAVVNRGGSQDPLYWIAGGAYSVDKDRFASIILPPPFGGNPPYSYDPGIGLPPGMNFAFGVISGTPSVEGTYSANLTVRDESTPPQMVSVSIVITVFSSGGSGTPLQIIGSSGSINVREYEYVVHPLTGASGGTPPYSNRISGEPLGLFISGNAISGQAQGNGFYSIRRVVTDNANPPAMAEETIRCTVTRARDNNSPLRWQIAPPSSINVRVGATTSFGVSATGGTPPYTYSSTSSSAGITSGMSGGSVTITGLSAGLHSVETNCFDATFDSIKRATTVNVTSA